MSTINPYSNAITINATGLFQQTAATKNLFADTATVSGGNSAVVDTGSNAANPTISTQTAAIKHALNALNGEPADPIVTVPTDEDELLALNNRLDTLISDFEDRWVIDKTGEEAKVANTRATNLENRLASTIAKAWGAGSDGYKLTESLEYNTALATATFEKKYTTAKGDRLTDMQKLYNRFYGEVGKDNGLGVNLTKAGTIVRANAKIEEIHEKYATDLISWRSAGDQGGSGNFKTPEAKANALIALENKYMKDLQKQYNTIAKQEIRFEAAVNKLHARVDKADARITNYTKPIMAQYQVLLDRKAELEGSPVERFIKNFGDKLGDDPAEMTLKLANDLLNAWNKLENDEKDEVRAAAIADELLDVNAFATVDLFIAAVETRREDLQAEEDAQEFVKAHKPILEAAKTATTTTLGEDKLISFKFAHDSLSNKAKSFLADLDNDLFELHSTFNADFSELLQEIDDKLADITRFASFLSFLGTNEGVFDLANMAKTEWPGDDAPPADIAKFIDDYSKLNADVKTLFDVYMMTNREFKTMEAFNNALEAHFLPA